MGEIMGDVRGVLSTRTPTQYQEHKASSFSLAEDEEEEEDGEEERTTTPDEAKHPGVAAAQIMERKKNGKRNIRTFAKHSEN